MHSSDTINAITQAFSVLKMGTNFQRLLGGLWVTVWIALVSVAFSLVLGFCHVLFVSESFTRGLPRTVLVTVGIGLMLFIGFVQFQRRTSAPRLP